MVLCGSASHPADELPVGLSKLRLVRTHVPPLGEEACSPLQALPLSNQNMPTQAQHKTTSALSWPRVRFHPCRSDAITITHPFFFRLISSNLQSHFFFSNVKNLTSSSFLISTLKPLQMSLKDLTASPPWPHFGKWVAVFGKTQTRLTSSQQIRFKVGPLTTHWITKEAIHKWYEFYTWNTLSPPNNGKKKIYLWGKQWPEQAAFITF